MTSTIFRPEPTWTRPSNRRSRAPRKEYELDEALLEKAVGAWIAVNLWLNRERDPDSGKERCGLKSPDEILAEGGVLVDDDPWLWMAYDCEIRSRAYERLEREPPDHTLRTWVRSDDDERNDIVRMFLEGTERKDIARQKGRSYCFVANTIRSRLGKRATA